MTIAVLGTGVFEPSFTPVWLWLAIAASAATIVLHRRTQQRLLPPRPEPDTVAGALRRESPAVVNTLTNDATVTASGYRATVIDLSARGWLRILPPADDVDELARVRPAATAYQGDSLRPHERLVLQHVMARFANDRAIPARYLAVDIRGGWWRRFSGLVIDEAVQAGLLARRWNVRDLLAPTGALCVAALCWYLAWATGDTEVAVIDSVGVRLLGWSCALLIVGGAIGLARTLARPTFTHTDAGIVAGWHTPPRCAWPTALGSNCRWPARTTIGRGAPWAAGHGWSGSAIRSASVTGCHRSLRSAPVC
jgi:hypothetical protein